MRSCFGHSLWITVHSVLVEIFLFSIKDDEEDELISLRLCVYIAACVLLCVFRDNYFFRLILVF